MVLLGWRACCFWWGCCSPWWACGCWPLPLLVGRFVLSGWPLVLLSPSFAFVCGVESAAPKVCSGHFLLACEPGLSFVPVARCGVGGSPRRFCALPVLVHVLVCVGVSCWCVTVLCVAAGFAPAQFAMWLLYMRGPVVSAAGWGLRSGACGSAVEPAGSLACAGVRGGGGRRECLSGGEVARLPPRPFAACWRLAGVALFWPVVVCAGGEAGHNPTLAYCP